MIYCLFLIIVEIRFSCSKMHPFYFKLVVNFDKYSYQFNRHNQDLEHYITSRCPLTLLHSQCLSLPWASNSYWSTLHSTVVFLEFYTNRIIQYMFFDVCILLFGIIFLRIIHVVWNSGSSFLIIITYHFIVWILRSLSLHLCGTLGLCPVLGCCEESCCYKHSCTSLCVDIWFCVSWINA